MNEAALAKKIEKVMDEIRTEETDPDASKKTFSEKLASAIVTEIKKITITATAPNGPVKVISIE